MKIVGCIIDWNTQYGNDALIRLTLDEDPSEEYIYHQVELPGGNRYYWAVRHGLIVSAYLSTHDHSGFGGSRIRLKLDDGSEVELVGPWDSHSLNRYSGLQTIPIAYSVKSMTYFAGYALVEPVQKYLTSFYDFLVFEPKGVSGGSSEKPRKPDATIYSLSKELRHRTGYWHKPFAYGGEQSWTVLGELPSELAEYPIGYFGTWNAEWRDPE